MQIRFDNYERCYPKRLKRLFLSDINYATYGRFIPQMKRAVVGNIPIEIIKLFPKEVRGEKIKLFQQILADTANTLRESFDEIKWLEEFSFLDENYRYSKFMKGIAQQGEDLINMELRALFGENYPNAKIKIAGHGSFSNVFRFSLYGADGKKIMHDKALKVYNSIYGDGHFAKSHNNYAEANFWTFLKRIAGHDLGKTQFTKHYISDLHSGYCMTEFIDSEIPKTESILPIFKLFKFRPPKDSQVNMPIMGKLADGGGFEKECGFLTDKIMIRISKMLYNAKGKMFDEIVANLTELVNNPKTPFRDKIRQVLELYTK